MIARYSLLQKLILWIGFLSGKGFTFIYTAIQTLYTAFGIQRQFTAVTAIPLTRLRLKLHTGGGHFLLVEGLAFTSRVPNSGLGTWQ